MKDDPERPTSLNATFKAHNIIFQVGTPLSFALSDANKVAKDQQDEINAVNKYMIEILDMLVDVFVTEDNKIYKPLNGRILTENERLVGFINFWTEVKYNFAFFDQVPDIDWQDVLIEYLPKVRNATSNLEYYSVLQEVCALLHDGHTNIFMPSALQRLIGTPAVTITPIEDALYVTNVAIDLSEAIPLGSKLIQVDHVDAETYILAHVRPYISSSTDYIRRNTEAREVLVGTKTDSVWVEIKTPEGKLNQLTLSRYTADVQWALPRATWELSSFKRYGDIAYVALNSFDGDNIVEAFEGYLVDEPVNVNVGYNVQAGCDAKHKLFVNIDTGTVNDTHSLSPMALDAKALLGVGEMKTLTDKGFTTAKHLEICTNNGITPYSSPKVHSSQHNGLYPMVDFKYDTTKDTYTCPDGQILATNGTVYDKAGHKVKHYKNRPACKVCPVRHLCTVNKNGRFIERSIYQEALEENQKKVEENPGYYRLRQQITEHQFGTIKRQWGFTFTLMKGKQNVLSEVNLVMIWYNLKRLMTILGPEVFRNRLKELGFELSALFRAFFTHFGGLLFSGNLPVTYRTNNKTSPAIA